MARIKPRRHGPLRPRKTSTSSAPKTSLDRSYAQKVRPDRRVAGIAYGSKARRAEFWDNIQAQQAQQIAEDVAAFSSMSPISEADLATANIHQATLESAAPSDPSSGLSVAGLGQDGFVPPPPTGAV